MHDAIMPDLELIPEDGLADELNRNVRTLQRWRAQRIGPPFIKIGSQVYYRRSRVREWVLDREQEQVRARG